MAFWGGILFSGSSITGSVVNGLSTDASRNMPKGTITRAIYAARSTSGASGAVGIRIFGAIGGMTMAIAGRTGISGVGDFEIWGLLGGSSTCISVRPSHVEIAPTIGGAVAASYTVAVHASIVTE